MPLMLLVSSLVTVELVVGLEVPVSAPASAVSAAPPQPTKPSTIHECIRVMS
jgi:hypothetical protein